MRLVVRVAAVPGVVVLFARPPGDEPEFLGPLARREHLHAHEALRAIDEMRARAECRPDFFGLPIGDHEAAEDDEHGGPAGYYRRSLGCRCTTTRCSLFCCARRGGRARSSRSGSPAACGSSFPSSM